MKQNLKRVLKYAVLILALGAIFFAGFYVGEYKTQTSTITPAEQKILLGNADFNIFWSVWQALKDNYLFANKLNPQQAVYGAVSGLVNSLGDPYTTFLAPDEAKNFEQDLSGSFGGIGIEIGVRRGILTVIAPLEDTPAKAAGLSSGDQIIKIDGKDTYNMPLDQAVNKIRGPIGTNVTLTIANESLSQPKDVTITRATIIVKAVSSKRINQDIGYLKINSFSETAFYEFENNLYNLMNTSTPPKAYIIDLRDDPGGYLEVAVDIAGTLLKKSSLVVSEDFNNKKPTFKHFTQGNEVLSNTPLIVLINKGSASAAEILAGALRDQRQIKLIGEQSFGKGSVQEGLSLDQGALLKVTIAQWLTPKGNIIQDKGLKPDITIVNTDPKVDAQLNKAIQVLENQLTSQ